MLLSIVLDGVKESSYLLCLDAGDMRELGRAEVGGVVGFGFHGAFWNGRGFDVGLFLVFSSFHSFLQLFIAIFCLVFELASQFL